MHRWTVLAVLVPALACTPDNEPEPAGRATVVVAIDGDTVLAEVGGAETTIRLIGIDSPETVHPTEPPECHGAEASAAMADLLPRGTPIRLERDAERTDRFDRLLAYVFRARDDLFVNEAMVARGHAAAVDYGANDAYGDRLDAAERRARDGDRGLWATCGGIDVPLPSAP